MSSPASPTYSLPDSFHDNDNESMVDDSDIHSWEELSQGQDENSYLGSPDQALRIPDDDVFGQLRNYLETQGNTPEHSDNDNEDHSGVEPVDVSPGDQVLPFTRNLAQMVRRSFAGFSPGSQGAGSVQQLSSFGSSSLSLPGTSSNQAHNVYKVNAVLLDPGVDSIPRRNNRTNLRDSGRIVQIALPRGAQGPETWRTLAHAFPLLRGMRNSNADDGFEVLVTDKTLRNTLIPANPPSCGFTAREIHKIAGQGSLYLRLVEASGQSQRPRQPGSTTGSRSSPGFLFRQRYLPRVPTQVTSTSTSTGDAGSSGSPARSLRAGVVSTSSITMHTSSVPSMTMSNTTSSTVPGLSTRLHSSPRSRAANQTTLTVSTMVHHGSRSSVTARRSSRPSEASPQSTGSLSRVRASHVTSTSTRTTSSIASTATGSVMTSLSRFSNGALVRGSTGGPSRVSTSSLTLTRTTTNNAITSAESGMRSQSRLSTGTLVRSSTGGSSRVSTSSATSTRTTANNRINSAGSGSGPDRLSRINALTAPPASTHITTTGTATGSEAGGSIRVRAPSTTSATTHTITAGSNSTSQAVSPWVMANTRNTTTATVTRTTRSTLSAVNQTSAQGPSSIGNGSVVAVGVGSDPTHTREASQAVAESDANYQIVEESSEEENVEEREEQGRRWRATLPSAAAAGARNFGGRSISSSSTLVTTTVTGPALSASIITTGVPRPSVENPSTVVTGTIEVPEANLLLDLLPHNQGQSLSALQSSIQMTQSASLIFNHPCTFHALMEMARMGGELNRPALMCVCTERQWLLWRPIFENRDIVKLVNEKFLLWVQSSNGTVGKQGLAVLKDQSNSGVMAVAYSIGDRKEVLLKIAGPPSVGELKRALEAALKTFEEHKRRWLALKRERDLKQQQDLEYEASLKADREKEQRKRNTKACQYEVPTENLSQSESSENVGTGKEPPPKRLRSDEMFRIIVVLPNGERHTLDVTQESTLKVFNLSEHLSFLTTDTKVMITYWMCGKC